MALDQLQAHRLFIYNKHTGELTRRITVSARGQKGAVVGWDNLNGGYKRTRINGKSYYIHRIIWLMAYGTMPKEIDHIDQDPSNNRVANLRSVTHLENLRNQKLASDNTSGHIGVSFSHSRNKWRAYIKAGSKQVSLGQYEHKQEAINARLKAQIDHGFHVNHGSKTEAI